MELHRTIWKASNQPLLYRTLDLLMNPYIFIIARAYSSRLPLVNRRENHEQYVRMVIKTPLDKIEDEVERYFGGLYSRIFDQSSVFPAFDTGDWADGMGNPLPLP
jgi:DNA-binding GntR family transcriptional regulator